MLTMSKCWYGHSILLTQNNKSHTALSSMRCSHVKVSKFDFAKATRFMTSDTKARCMTDFIEEFRIARTKSRKTCCFVWLHGPRLYCRVKHNPFQSNSVKKLWKKFRLVPMWMISWIDASEFLPWFIWEFVISMDTRGENKISRTGIRRVRTIPILHVVGYQSIERAWRPIFWSISYFGSRSIKYFTTSKCPFDAAIRMAWLSIAAGSIQYSRQLNDLLMQHIEWHNYLQLLDCIEILGPEEFV